MEHVCPALAVHQDDEAGIHCAVFGTDRLVSTAATGGRSTQGGREMLLASTIPCLSLVGPFPTHTPAVLCHRLTALLITHPSGSIAWLSMPNTATRTGHHVFPRSRDGRRYCQRGRQIVPSHVERSSAAAWGEEELDQ